MRVSEGGRGVEGGGEGLCTFWSWSLVFGDRVCGGVGGEVSRFAVTCCDLREGVGREIMGRHVVGGVGEK